MADMLDPLLLAERKNFHQTLLEEVLHSTEGALANADKHNGLSRELCAAVASRIGGAKTADVHAMGQTLGDKFESCVEFFLRATFLKLQHLRPGDWSVDKITKRTGLAIAEYEQYAHLIDLEKAAKASKALAAALGHDYSISPDIVVTRLPLEDKVINQCGNGEIVSDGVAKLTPLRARNNSLPMLHASVSCKFTIRSDRSQNARTEALNLIRNRKGKLPHIMVVTAECLPSRLASLALGTGDIDCLYHFALDELVEAVSATSHSDSQEMLETLRAGKRIKDISDLPLDLAI